MPEQVGEAEFARRRKRWAEELRSGKYRQAFTQLSKDGGYCCLGVACRLFREETQNGEWVPSPRGGWAFSVTQDGVRSIATEVLPGQVREYFGLTTIAGHIDEPQNPENIFSLASLNDQKVSFAKIAQVIEDAPVGLFMEGTL